MKNLFAIVAMAAMIMSVNSKAQASEAELSYSTQITNAAVLLHIISQGPYPHRHHHHRPRPRPHWLVQLQNDTVDFLGSNVKTAFLDQTINELRLADELKEMDDMQIAAEILMAAENY